MGMECLIKKYIMDALSYKDTISKQSHCYKRVDVDADGHNLGRLASKVAMILEVSTSQVTHHTLTVEIT
jgi:ribosomal protein L13